MSRRILLRAALSFSLASSMNLVTLTGYSSNALNNSASTDFSTKEILSNSVSKTADKSRAESFKVNETLSFEENSGQLDPSIKFISHARNYSVFLTDKGAQIAY